MLDGALTNPFYEVWYQNQRQYQKEYYRPVPLMNTDTKILNKVPKNRTEQCTDRITHYDQVGFIPEMQDWLNSKNQSYQSYKTITVKG